MQVPSAGSGEDRVGSLPTVRSHNLLKGSESRTFPAGCTIETPETTQQGWTKKVSRIKMRKNHQKLGEMRLSRLLSLERLRHDWGWKKLPPEKGRRSLLRADEVQLPRPSRALWQGTPQVLGKGHVRKSVVRSDHYTELQPLSKGPAEAGWASMVPWA